MAEKKRETGLRNQLKKRWPLVIGIVLFLIILAACALYHQMAIAPMDCYEIGPGTDSERWRFTLEDGTVLLPEDGVLPIDGTDITVICQTDITEPVANKPLIVITANSTDCVFLSNGRIIYSPSGRYSDGGFDPIEYKKTSASGQLRLNLTESSQLTMVVQFQGNEYKIRRKR